MLRNAMDRMRRWSLACILVAAVAVPMLSGCASEAPVTDNRPRTVNEFIGQPRLAP